MSFLGYCGIDCERCPVYIFTAGGDRKIFDDFVDQLVENYGGSREDYEQYRCVGCRGQGEKPPHCSTCDVAMCAKVRNFQTCAQCGGYNRCTVLRNQWESAIQPARENLERLREDAGK